MHKCRILETFVAILLLMSGLSTYMVLAQTSSIEIELDKSEASIGDVINAEIKVNNIKNISGFQLNIKYDPEVLVPLDNENNIPFESDTKPLNGTLIINSEYEVLSIAQNNIDYGTINLSRCYRNVDKYRENNNPESSGTLVKIAFKVKKNQTTSIYFDDSVNMPNSTKGIVLYDWFGNICKEYSVIQPQVINSNSSTQIVSNPNTLSGKITLEVSSVDGYLGDNVLIQINLIDIPETGINNCDFKLAYDKTKVEIIDINAGIVTRNPEVNFSSYVDIEKGQIGLMYTDETGLGSQSITSEGLFAVLSVKIKENLPREFINIKIIDEPIFSSYDLKNISVTYKDGGINIVDQSATKEPILVITSAPDIISSKETNSVEKKTSRKSSGSNTGLESVPKTEHKTEPKTEQSLTQIPKTWWAP